MGYTLGANINFITQQTLLCHHFLTTTDKLIFRAQIIIVETL